jgi:hypothetical protein
MTLMGDSRSGVVQGSYIGQIDNLLVSSALVNNLYDINFSTLTGQAFGLVVGVSWGTEDPGNIANLYQFELLA